MLCALKRYCLIPSGAGNTRVNFERPRDRGSESKLTHLDFLLGLRKRVTLLAMAVRPDLPGNRLVSAAGHKKKKTGTSRTDILVHPEEGESFDGPPGRRERAKHSGDDVTAREARDEVDQSRRAGRRDANEPVFVLSRESAAAA